jgi:hypothetical protein
MTEESIRFAREPRLPARNAGSAPQWTMIQNDAFNKIVILSCAFLVGGCVTRVVHYSRPDTTQQQFMQDRYECLQEAQQRVSGAAVTPYGGGATSRVVANCGVWLSCLGARGYTTDPNGDLFAPPGMAVYCQK